MSRTSRAQLDQMFAHACRCAKLAGLDTERWKLEYGHAAMGIAYVLDIKLTRVRLGATPNEAHRSLELMAEAWRLVGHHVHSGGSA